MRLGLNEGIIIQARLDSNRCPRKVLREIKGKKLIDIVVDECKKTTIPVYVVIPRKDKELNDYLYSRDIVRFSGPEYDVISRYYHCARHYEIDPIIRVTGDAKMIKADLILQQLENYKKYGHLCYGNFCEVFSFKQLEDYYLHDKRPQTREHVTLGMIQDMSVDYEIDLH